MGGTRPGSRGSRRSWRWSTPTTPTRSSSGCSPSPSSRRWSQQSVQLTTYPRVMANADLGPQHGGRASRTRDRGSSSTSRPSSRARPSAMLDAGDVVLLPDPRGRRRRRGRAEDATAYAHRSANFSVDRDGREPPTASTPVGGRRRHGQGMYLSFDTSLRPERIDRGVPARDARAAARDQGRGRPRRTCSATTSR